MQGYPGPTHAGYGPASTRQWKGRLRRGRRPGSRRGRAGASRSRLPAGRWSTPSSTSVAKLPARCCWAPSGLRGCVGAWSADVCNSGPPTSPTTSAPSIATIRFPWQQALVDLLAADDRWPPVLDLPTGAGKTAALDVAVFHLALRADTPWDAALRIALVVDRRLVVDHAFERATRIARALADGLADAEFRGPVVREVARRLQHLASGGDAPPLVARRLRGGAPLEHDWARTPTQPTILCSTVDQIGSRLLFRGYGVSSRMRPVHAGLLGEDSLILLDEAHLSEPFRRTLADIQELGQARVKSVLLSATPGTLEHSPFSLTRQDREHLILKSRLEAAKPARLMKPVRKSPAGAFADTARNMAERRADHTVSLRARGSRERRIPDGAARARRRSRGGCARAGHRRRNAVAAC